MLRACLGRVTALPGPAGHQIESWAFRVDHLNLRLGAKSLPGLSDDSDLGLLGIG